MPGLVTLGVMVGETAAMPADVGVNSVVMEDETGLDETAIAADVGDETTIVSDGTPTGLVELAWSHEDAWEDLPTSKHPRSRSLRRWGLAVAAVLVAGITAGWFGTVLYYDEEATPTAKPAVIMPTVATPAQPPAPTAKAPTSAPPFSNLPPRSAPPAPSAQQDAKFLELMHDYGLVPPNSDQEEVNAGRTVCTRLNEGEPYQLLIQNAIDGSAESADRTGNGNGMDHQQAQQFVDTAINIYCPQ